MFSAASSPRTLLPILAIVAGVVCVQGACSLRPIDNLGNGLGQDGAPTGGTFATGGAASGGASASGGAESGGATGQGGSSPTGGASGDNGAGGDTASGGNSSEGGNAGADAAQDASGGATATGGKGAGGAAASGGTVASGGSGTGGSGTGGSTGFGGSTGLGGSAGLGGSTVSSSPVTTTCPGAIPRGITADWCSCGTWGTLNKGAATYYNDIWGFGPGPQCIWVAGDKWGATANHPSGGRIKAYPNISYSPGMALGAIKTYTSSFDVTVPTSGTWGVAYDIFAKNSSGKRTEILLWMNFTSGTVFPLSDAGSVSNVSVGGHSWDVSYSSLGGNNTVSLLRTSNTNSGTVDIKAILDWIIANKNFFDSSYTLDQVQFGFEIVTDGAPQSFVVNSFSVLSS